MEPELVPLFVAARLEWGLDTVTLSTYYNIYREYTDKALQEVLSFEPHDWRDDLICEVLQQRTATLSQPATPSTEVP